MSINIRKNRLAFRPVLSGSTSTLEERVVMAVSGLFTPLPAPPPISSSNVGFGVRQIQADYLQAFRAARGDLQTSINTQVQQLFANGTPTQKQLNDFAAGLGGTLNATSFRLSSQGELLPNSQKLVQNIQNSLLSDGSKSLVSRLNALGTNARAMRSANTFNAAVNAQVARTMSANLGQINNYFKTTSVNRLSVDQSGARIPFQQYLGQQVIRQFTNTLGALANSFSTVATTVLFPRTGSGTATTPTVEALTAFQSQYGQALQIATAQLGNDLSLFGGGRSVVSSQVQTAFYGNSPRSSILSGAGDATSTGPGSITGLFQSLKGLNFTDVSMSSNAYNSFNQAATRVASSLNQFFGMSTSPNQTLVLPTSRFSLPSAGQNFFNTTLRTDGTNVGFNNGFGSGFLGFGQTPPDFNTNFSTQFNTVVTNTNRNFGITLPSDNPANSGLIVAY